jgi:hypothetical protein
MQDIVCEFLRLPLLGTWGAEGQPRVPLGLVGPCEEGEDTLIDPTEPSSRGDVATAFEAFGQGKVRKDLSRPREYRPGGEERVLLGGEHRHRSPVASELFLGRHTGKPSVKPEVPVDRPQLPYGGIEEGVLGLGQQGPRCAK